MPPTSNRLYLPIKNRFVPTKELKLWKKEISLYAAMHFKEIQEISAALTCFIEEGKVIHIDRRFYFPLSSIFTKAGKPKKIDVSNRIKALDDGVCEFIKIDDKLIFSSSTKKYCHIETLSKRVEVDIWSIPVEFRK